MSTLAELLSSRVKAETFRLLFGSVDRELHLREMERQSGLAEATVRQELKKLTRLGLVERRPDGNRTYYRANRGHPLYQDIRNLVLKTSGLVDVLWPALDHGGIQMAFVFGSMADGTENAHSDIDLMVIGTLGLRQLVRQLSGLSAKLGRELNPHVLTPEEFVRRKKSRDHFLTTVLKGPHLWVIGSQHELEAMGK